MFRGGRLAVDKRLCVCGRWCAYTEPLHVWKQMFELLIIDLFPDYLFCWWSLNRYTVVLFCFFKFDCLGLISFPGDAFLDRFCECFPCYCFNGLILFCLSALCPCFHLKLPVFSPPAPRPLYVWFLCPLASPLASPSLRLYLWLHVFSWGASEGKMVVLALAIGVAEQDDFANIPDLQEAAQAAPPPANQEPPPEKRYQITCEGACVRECVWERMGCGW